MTHYAIMSDIHGNELALEAVLRDMDGESKANGEKIENIFCLGDIVGYGPRPSECISLVRERNMVCVRGNHDDLACGRYEITDGWNDEAKESGKWTCKNISEEDKHYLRNLKLIEVRDNFTLSHGSLFKEPNLDYVIGPGEAFDKIFCKIVKIDSPKILEKLEICFIGHTHSPCCYSMKKNIVNPTLDNVHGIHAFGDFTTDLDKECYYVINCGSVGQSRDGDSRACYLTYNSEKRLLKFHRVNYNIEQVRLQLMDAGLPLSLGDRLEMGR